MAPLAHTASIWAAPGSWNIELTQGGKSRKEIPGRAGRKSPQSYEPSLCIPGCWAGGDGQTTQVRDGCTCRVTPRF